MRDSTGALLAIVLVAGFLFGLWELYQLRFEAGDIYPPYSSLRADPLGAKALFEIVPQLPGMSAARNYRPLTSLKTPATVLLLGQNPFAFAGATEDDLKELEALARSGSRVIVGMRPVQRVLEPKPLEGPLTPEKAAPPELPPIQKRWGVRFDYVTKPTGTESEEATSSEPKVTALFFRHAGKVEREVELPFGSGSVVLVANGYPFSNEALAHERDAGFLVRMLTAHPLVIFDEEHLGLTESGSVGALVRKYRLEGAAAMLAVLLSLFIWKNSTSFLPPRAESSGPGVETKDAGAGLTNLLRRNIPASKLLATCWDEWERSHYGGRRYSRTKIEVARAVTSGDRDAVEAIREVARILAERT